MMIPYERELVLAMARFLVSGEGRDVIVKAIANVEADERCPFDGNIRPCPHHEVSGQRMVKALFDYSQTHGLND